jgi:hypothetical protein
MEGFRNETDRIACLDHRSVLAHATAAVIAATGRSSRLKMTCLYGFGGQSQAGVPEIIDHSLLSTDSQGIGHTGTENGVLVSGSPWSAVSTRWSPTSLRSAPAKLVAYRLPRVATATVGVGKAQVLASNRGNQLVVHFTLAGPEYLSQAGALNQPPAFTPPTRFIALPRFDSIIFQNVSTTTSLPGGHGSFQLEQTVPAGSRRIVSQLAMSASGSFGRLMPIFITP